MNNHEKFTNENNQADHNKSLRTERIDTVQTGQNMQHIELNTINENIFDSNDCIITDGITSQYIH